MSLFTNENLLTIYDEKCQSIINIVIGKNAEDNWKILAKSRQNDIIFHLDKLSSPYVIILNPPNIISSKTLYYVASLCKEHSKYNNIDRVAVIYTTVKNVSRGDVLGSLIMKKTSRIVI